MTDLERVLTKRVEEMAEAQDDIARTVFCLVPRASMIKILGVYFSAEERAKLFKPFCHTCGEHKEDCGCGKRGEG